MEAGVRYQKNYIKKVVNDLLNTRVQGVTFLQDGPCFKMSNENRDYCHECKNMSITDKIAIIDKNLNDVEISCSFYNFRKLQKYKNSVNVAGYLDPHVDVGNSDLDIWKESLTTPAFADKEKAKFMLGLIGDQFCDMVLAEQKLHLEAQLMENKTLVWKPAVKGVREMCDVCETTIFDHHWTCGRCGVFVCLDDYKFRKGGLIKEKESESSAESYRDEYNWPLCTNGASHDIRKLILAQIIPKNELVNLADKLHNVRLHLNLNQFCHPQREDFSEAYSLKRLAVKNSRHVNMRAVQRASMIGHSTSTYACRLCPETSFKWQSELYKHCLINHFNEEIRAMLPTNTEPPFKCPKCDYHSKQKYALILHIGISHKVVLQFIEEAMKSNQSLGGQSMIISRKSEAPPIIFSKNPVAQRSRFSDANSTVNQSSPLSYNCPLCSLSVSNALKRHHLVKHFYVQLSAEIATKSGASSSEPPFECHLCHHVALTYNALIKHVGIFHKLVDKYIDDYNSTEKATPSASETDEEKTENLEAAKPEISSLTNSTTTSYFECRLCNTPEFFKNNNDLMRHLSHQHFSQRIWKDHVADKSKRPFACPYCDYTNAISYPLITHIGVVHKIAIKYYCEALNITETDWNSRNDPFSGNAMQVGGRKLTPSSSVTSTGLGVSSYQQQPFQSSSSNTMFASGKENMSNGSFMQPEDQKWIPTLVTNMTGTGLMGSTNQKQNFQSSLLNTKSASGRENMSNGTSMKAGGQELIQSSASDMVDQALTESTQPSMVSSNSDQNRKVPLEVFVCRLCPGTAFRCQSEVHKHCLVSHFNDQIREMLPVEGPPYKCPRCDYAPKQKYALFLHFGIKHNVVQQLMEDAAKSNPKLGGESMISTMKGEEALPLMIKKNPVAKKISHSETNSSSTNTKPTSDRENMFNDPGVQVEGQKLNQPSNHISASNLEGQGFMDSTLPTGLPINFEPNRGKSVMDSAIPLTNSSNLDQNRDKSGMESAMQLNPSSTLDKNQGLDLIDLTLPSTKSSNLENREDSTNTSSPPKRPRLKLDENSLECKICDMKNKNMSELLNHLSKVHYMHKLKTMVPETQPYKCPWTGCETLKKDKYGLALHYGTFHKVAFKLMQESPEDALTHNEEVVCKLCQQGFTAHRYFFTHLAETHFKAELENDLPSSKPWQCPKCPYVGNERGGEQKALRIHYGVKHRVVLDHLALKLGIDVNVIKKEMEGSRKRAHAETINGDTSRHNAGATFGEASQQQNQLNSSQTYGMVPHSGEPPNQYMQNQSTPQTHPENPYNTYNSMSRQPSQHHQSMSAQMPMGSNMQQPQPYATSSMTSTPQNSQHQKPSENVSMSTYSGSQQQFQSSSSSEMSTMRHKSSPYSNQQDLRQHQGLLHSPEQPKQYLSKQNIPPNQPDNSCNISKPMRVHLPEQQQSLPAQMSMDSNLPQPNSKTSHQQKSYDHVSVSVISGQQQPFQASSSRKISAPGESKSAVVIQKIENPSSTHTSASHLSQPHSRLPQSAEPPRQYAPRQNIPQVNLEKAHKSQSHQSIPAQMPTGSNPQQHHQPQPYAATKMQSMVGSQVQQSKQQKLCNKTSTLPHFGSQQSIQSSSSGTMSASSGENLSRSSLEHFDEKQFPKCRLCNYRYFTRLDLCRHFVDYHLRSLLANLLDDTSQNCPAPNCPLSFEKKQSRLRHFIWHHQNLEAIVMQECKVKLSELTPTKKDLEMVRRKTANTEPSTEFKYITDMAAFSVSDTIDVKLERPFCELCGEDFDKSVNKALDKNTHLMGHFREDIMKDYQNNNAVFYAMQRELGDSWKLVFDNVTSKKGHVQHIGNEVNLMQRIPMEQSLESSQQVIHRVSNQNLTSTVRGQEQTRYNPQYNHPEPKQPLNKPKKRQTQTELWVEHYFQKQQEFQKQKEQSQFEQQQQNKQAYQLQQRSHQQGHAGKEVTVAPLNANSKNQQYNQYHSSQPLPSTLNTNPGSREQQNNQYYSTQPGSSSNTQYSPGHVQVQPQTQQAQQQQTSLPSFNQLMSPSSNQISPLNLSSKSYISPQGTPSQNGQQPQYYNSQ